jgi:hypothetical protein
MCIALVHIADAPQMFVLNRKTDESKSIKCAGNNDRKRGNE